MSKQEEIIKILKEVYWEEFDYSQPEWKKESEKWFKDKANQILRILEGKMTKQKEIQEGIAKVAESTWYKYDYDIVWQEIAKAILVYLDSQGIVMKVDRELPLVKWDITGSETPSQAEKIGNAFRKAYAGYVATESLMKE